VISTSLLDSGPTPMSPITKRPLCCASRNQPALDTSTGSIGVAGPSAVVPQYTRPSGPATPTELYHSVERGTSERRRSQ
jgi:hypothetical protein